MKTVFVAAKYIPGYVESVGRNRRFDSRAIVISNHNGWTFDLQRTLPSVSFIARHEPELNLRMWEADGELRHRQAVGMRSRATS
jgi:hypothetical protein